MLNQGRTPVTFTSYPVTIGPSLFTILGKTHLPLITQFRQKENHSSSVLAVSKDASQSGNSSGPKL